MNGSFSGERHTRKEKGAAAENAAVQYLTSQGYRVLERNWRCRSGELDIISELGQTLVFVEVRSRSGSLLQGTPEESVNWRKIRQVRSTAQVYLYRHKLEERKVSFDVISVLLHEDLQVASLRHICEAF
ncbi:UPF0102 protein [Paenibacillus albidus]|uniref:UPF0102 protein GCM10010912_26930 n=1 Tax=Paenibacillus albidus TaxID=2041023 RepID=A0A917CD97_9BACL|nr:YraN family protein [Paenibacillus albidus]GGF80437.1 UPF0102 protein [Paenibacillus albidus]